MDNQENVNEVSLPKRKGFYSHLNMEYITDRDYSTQKEFVKILM